MVTGINMKSCAVITINDQGIKIGLEILDQIRGSILMLPGSSEVNAKVFDVGTIDDIKDERLVRVVGADLGKLTKESFTRYGGLVMIMALGIVVRMIAPNIESKKKDPAVVAVDNSGQYSISVLSGHAGGANKLAVEVATAIGAEPVITTASESKRTLSIGIGCRKGVSKEQVRAAVENALRTIEKEMDDVRWISTIDIKREEKALADFAGSQCIPLRFFNKQEIAALQIPYQRSEIVKRYLDVYGVSEPCAILASSGGQLLLKRQVIGDVTVAIAKRKVRDV